jgi:hypothetical protein
MFSVASMPVFAPDEKPLATSVVTSDFGTSGSFFHHSAACPLATLVVTGSLSHQFTIIA